MKIEMTDQAQVVLTSSNPIERDYLIKKYELFSNRITATMASEPTEKRTYTKHKVNYMKTCTVEGCEIKAKGLIGVRAHQRTHHGIDKEGNIHNTYKCAPTGNLTEVKSPVVSFEEGKFRLKS